MKKLFRVIFYIPKLLLQFIWNLIWAIFKLALVLALIGYGLVYYANKIGRASCRERVCQYV